MRTPSLVLSFVIGLAGGFACAPAKKCTPTTCSGCCTAEDTCDMSNTVSACGKGGALCDRCVGTQTCSDQGRCMGGPTGGGSGGGSTGGGSVDPGELNGTFQELWGWDGDGGTTPSRANFQLATVGVWYRDGGAWDFIRGSSTAGGTFRVRGLPAGDVLLQVADRYFVTSERVLRFDTFTGGRLDAERAGEATQAFLNLTGFAPSGPERDAFLFFTQNTARFNLDTVTGAAAGTTTYDQTINWSRQLGAAYALPNAARGDRGYAYQLEVEAFDGGGGRSWISRGAELPSYTLTSGNSAPLAAMVAPLTGQSTSWTFDLAAFGAQKALLGRAAGAAQLVINVGTSPAPSPQRYVSQAPIELAQTFAREPNQPSAIDLASPFPASWGRQTEATYAVTFTRSVGDGGTPVAFNGFVSAVDNSASLTGTVTPRLTPVRDPQIAGRSLLDDQSGVGTSPTLSWSAPQTGTVSSYRVSVTEVTPTGAGALVRLYTRGTSVTLPPGILQAGRAYVIEAEALSFGEGAISFTIPYALSGVVSGVIQP